MTEDADRPWGWYHTADDETYQGPHPTKEAAIEDAKTWGYTHHFDGGAYKLGFSVIEARPEKLSDKIFDCWHILERFDERNEEALNEDGNVPDMEPTAEQQKELEGELTAVFSAWRKRHGLGRSWALEFNGKPERHTIKVEG